MIDHGICDDILACTNEVHYSLFIIHSSDSAISFVYQKGQKKEMICCFFHSEELSYCNDDKRLSLPAWYDGFLGCFLIRSHCGAPRLQ